MSRMYFAQHELGQGVDGHGLETAEPVDLEGLYRSAYRLQVSSMRGSGRVHGSLTKLRRSEAQTLFGLSAQGAIWPRCQSHRRKT